MYQCQFLTFEKCNKIISSVNNEGIELYRNDPNYVYNYPINLK